MPGPKPPDVPLTDDERRALLAVVRAKKTEQRIALRARIILVLADGRRVPAKRITIDSIRVGRFVVEDVEGAVLPAELTEASLILGMSYLSNFKFDIDPGTMKLRMTRLDGDDLEPQRPGPKEKPGATPKKKDAEGAE